MEEKKMTTKERLLFLTNRGVKITEFASRVKCHKNTLSMWLRGESNLSARLERDINNAINLFLKELEEIKEENNGINLHENKPKRR